MPDPKVPDLLKAHSIIKKCRKTRAAKLDLSNLNLSEVPEEEECWNSEHWFYLHGDDLLKDQK
jgi:hypothetical protein